MKWKKKKKKKKNKKKKKEKKKKKKKASPFMKLQEDYDYFQKLVLMHSIDRPPMSKKYFSLEQMKQITEYATNT